MEEFKINFDELLKDGQVLSGAMCDWNVERNENGGFTIKPTNYREDRIYKPERRKLKWVIHDTKMKAACKAITFLENHNMKNVAKKMFSNVVYFGEE